MHWCGARWGKRKQLWLNWGGRGGEILAPWKGLVFFPSKIPVNSLFFSNLQYITFRNMPRAILRSTNLAASFAMNLL